MEQGNRNRWLGSEASNAFCQFRAVPTQSTKMYYALDSIFSIAEKGERLHFLTWAWRAFESTDESRNLETDVMFNLENNIDAFEVFVGHHHTPGNRVEIYTACPDGLCESYRKNGTDGTFTLYTRESNGTQQQVKTATIVYNEVSHFIVAHIYTVGEGSRLSEDKKLLDPFEVLSCSMASPLADHSQRPLLTALLSSIALLEDCLLKMDRERDVQCCSEELSRSHLNFEQLCTESFYTMSYQSAKSGLQGCPPIVFGDLMGSVKAVEMLLDRMIFHQCEVVRAQFWSTVERSLSAIHRADSILLKLLHLGPEFDPVNDYIGDLSGGH